ncbi:MAG: GTPase ObgE [Clostridia bacterium]|nr:GTPase ObgE [Clostridia bacterium]
MFIDKIKIYVKAGNGGNGAVSFRREKYVAKGGPDGGDGGNGGNIIFRCDHSVNTLLAFRYKRKFTAEPGGDGMGAKCHGKNGEDVIIHVPRGTLIKDPESGKIIKDMCDDDDFILCKGGRGGWGNKHFATPTRQIPRFAKNGLPGEEKEVILELKMIADVGFVGLPSAGKSSLLAAISAARPKIADYHFTTLEPSLGVVSLGGEAGFVAADIPGLIEGASDGLGLGHDFLRHIERCRMLIHVVDVAGTEGRTPVEDFKVISEELEKFSPTLAALPRIIAANKADLMVNGEEEFAEIPEVSEEAAELEAEAARHGYEVVYISAGAKMNLRSLITKTAKILETLPPVVTYEPEIIPVAEEEDDLAGAEAVTIRRADNASFIVSGEWAEKLMGRVNFSDKESLMYFERSLIRAGIIDRLRAAGCEEGDTVSFCGMEFDFID